MSFGLAHYALSEFELLAEELLMSDSIIKVSGHFINFLLVSWSVKMSKHVSNMVINLVLCLLLDNSMSLRIPVASY